MCYNMWSTDKNFTFHLCRLECYTITMLNTRDLYRVSSTLVPFSTNRSLLKQTVPMATVTQWSHVVQVTKLVVRLLWEVFAVSVSFPNEEVTCDEGNGIKNRKATAPPKIIRDITRGISRFTIRVLFCDEVRLWLLFISAVASDLISSWWLSLSEVLPSFESKASLNWELSASTWLRNSKDEVLLIQLARFRSEINRHISLQTFCIKLKVRAWRIKLNYKNNNEVAEMFCLLLTGKKKHKKIIPFSKIQFLLRSVIKQKFCQRGLIWMQTLSERHF